MNKAAGVLLFSLLLSGCGIKDSVSGLFSGESEEDLVTEALAEIEQSIEIEELWSTSIGGGTEGYYLKLSPVFSEDVIYAAEYDGDVIALNPETGKSIWKHDTDKTLIGGPGHGEGLVLLGTRDGEVIALSDETGEELWTSQLSSEVLSVPKADLGVVVVRTGDGKVFGLEANTGQRLWVYEHSVPLLTLRGTSSPQLEDGTAIIGFDGGTLTALNISDGAKLWEIKVSRPTGRSSLERMVDIDADPVIEGGTIYVATFQGKVAAVNIGDGRIAWVRDISSHAGLDADFDHIYLTDEKSDIWALDPYSGNSVWKQEDLKSRSLTAPVVFEQLVVVGDFEGYLHWMSRNDGHLVGRIKMGSSKITAAPFIANNILYAYSSDGTFAAYRVK